MTNSTVTSLFGDNGHAAPCRWAPPDQAHALALALADQHRAAHSEVMRNPHLDHAWAVEIATHPVIAGPVRQLLGPAAAIENTFLLIKWPHGQVSDDFAVPPHQDGTNKDMELDPARAVACWVAISDASTEAGGIEAVPGSHAWGYLPHEYGPPTRRGRGLTAADAVDDWVRYTAMPMSAGQALHFDVRLLHRSGPNTTDHPRIGLNIRYCTPAAFRRGSASARPGWMPLTLPQP
ncbi:phytanoyl-CoA dioxygenase family protein [Nocardia sp. NPDC050435]|uniref:phytanoyl-CoA dioxygenase family protein n=1 Tax=Nocardia sp. NPDC050435 TaxID=3155040 RepID=UPI0034105062